MPNKKINAKLLEAGRWLKIRRSFFRMCANSEPFWRNFISNFGRFIKTPEPQAQLPCVKREHSPTYSQSGFALLLALWATALISLILLSMISVARTKIAVARNVLNVAELELAADGAVAITKLALLSATRGPGESTSLWNGLQQGESVLCSERPFTVSIRVQNEAGKIDLNAADVNTLASLLEAAGLGGIRASTMANAIKDFSRAYPERGLSESPMTAKADRIGALPPKHAPFETTLELDQIADMDSQTFDRLLPLVTVYSGRADTAPLSASPAMEAALTPPATGDVFLIRVEAFSSTGGRFVREAIVELTGDARYLKTREWRRGRPRSAVAHAEDVLKRATVDLPECQSLLQ